MDHAMAFAPNGKERVGLKGRGFSVMRRWMGACNETGNPWPGVNTDSRSQGLPSPYGQGHDSESAHDRGAGSRHDVGSHRKRKQEGGGGRKVGGARLSVASFRRVEAGSIAEYGHAEAEVEGLVGSMVSVTR